MGFKEPGFNLVRPRQRYKEGKNGVKCLKAYKCQIHKGLFKEISKCVVSAYYRHSY